MENDQCLKLFKQNQNQRTQYTEILWMLNSNKLRKTEDGKNLKFCNMDNKKLEVVEYKAL